MSTITTKTIGTSSRNYSTISAWEAASPANLTTSIAGGEVWKGVCYNDSTFYEQVAISGITTDATGYVWLTVADGHSFCDDSAHALVYNASNGVALHNSDNFARILPTHADYTRVERLQIKQDSASNGTYSVCGTDSYRNVTIRECLLQTASAAPLIGFQSTASNNRAINCVLIQDNAAGYALDLAGGAACINCTVVAPAGSSVEAISVNWATCYVNNCAVFGFAGFQTSYSGYSVTGDYNATDLASGAPGANSLHNLTFADQFVSTTNDFRLKSGADLIDAGNTDATYAPLDIFGTTRGTTTDGDIGAHEYATSSVDDTATPSGKAAQAAKGSVAVVIVQDATASPSGKAASASKGSVTVDIIGGGVEVIRPSVDINAGTWTPSSGADLYAMLDETVATDADYIASAWQPSDDTCEIKLTAPSAPPDGDTGHVVRYRIGAGGINGGTLDVSLYCGATLIKTWAHDPLGDLQTFEQTLTEIEAAAINDYADLRLRFVAG